jgi:hypothetical protein
MSSHLLAGFINPDTVTNPVLGPNLQGAIGEFGSSPAWFFQTFIPMFITLGFIIGVIVFFFVLIIGAIQWISSGGDKQALEGARGKISNALIGLVILFATFAIIKLIETFFGFSILTLDIGGLIIK